MKAETLKIRWSFEKTFWFTLIEFLILFGTAELITRSELFQAPLMPPRLGSRHYQLGYKLALLDAAVKKNGPIDCVMIGSSMVDVGFNPDYFQKGYREIVQRKINCFNFGIDAATAASNYALAKVIVEDYRPRILIMGTDARDYVVPLEDTDVTVILETPWIRYRLGDFSLNGWLTEHSYLYRYRQHLSHISRLNVNNVLKSEARFTNEILNNGFTPINKTSTYINDPPRLGDTSFEVRYYSRIYSSYQVLDGNLAALEQILKMNELDTQVILVEMPISNGLYYFFGNGQADYTKFTSHVSELASHYQVPFWQTEVLDLIPDDGWADYSHLNTKGAELFSTWLGHNVGKVEIQGMIEVNSPQNFEPFTNEDN